MLLGWPFESVAQKEEEPLVTPNFCPGNPIRYRGTRYGGSIDMNGVEQGIHVIVLANLQYQARHASLEKHHTQKDSLKRERQANDVLGLVIRMRFYVCTVFRGPRVQGELLRVWRQSNINQPFELVEGLESNCHVLCKSVLVQVAPVEVTDHQLVEFDRGYFGN